ncbi:unnamed protein product, partial [Sphagnum balticum]
GARPASSTPAGLVLSSARLAVETPVRVVDGTPVWVVAEPPEIPPVKKPAQPNACEPPPPTYEMATQQPPHYMTERQHNDQNVPQPVSYTQRGSLVRHIRVRHWQEQRPSKQKHNGREANERKYKCTHCARGFNFSTNMHKHVRRVHLGVKDERHVCTTCSAAFPSPSELKIHTRMHTGERPHKCTVCAMAFSRICTLR